jgi:hypothetical protein
MPILGTLVRQGQEKELPAPTIGEFLFLFALRVVLVIPSIRKEKPMAEMPEGIPHGLAIQTGYKEKIKGEERFWYHAGTHKCEEEKCEVVYNIFVDIPHYDCGPQFSKYLGKVLKIDHQNKRTHLGYILFPMEAEFTT